MDAIRKYFDLNKKECYQKINDEIASDLNLDELFSTIDYTESPIGQQILYNTLRTIPTENSIIKDNERWIDHYSKEDNVKNKVSKILSKLDKFDSYFVYSLITENYVPFSKKQIYLFRFLQVLPSIFLISLIVLKSWIFILSLFISYLINLYIHYSSKSKLFAFSGSIPMLRQVMNACRNLNKNTELQCELIRNSEIKDAIHSTKEVYRNLSNYRFWVILDSDITMIIWAITELLRAFFLSEVFNLHSIFKQISQHRKSLICIFEFVGLIDTLSSVDKMRKASKNYCIPIFDNKSLDTDLQDIYHPLIENCVSNSLSLSKDSYLILGSNMSGKTSFIRTVGVNILLAQTINTCFAKRATLHKQKIYSVITVNDSIMKGQSYYLSEVLKIKDLLNNTEQGSNLILLDELFKGTNTIERVAAAKAVLKYLLKNKANRILVATHDFELMELLNNDYSQIFFEENITNNKLSFDYKISFKPTGKRNAIKILELYEFPKEVVDDALTTIPNKV